MKRRILPLAAALVLALAPIQPAAADSEPTSQVDPEPTQEQAQEGEGVEAPADDSDPSAGSEQAVSTQQPAKAAADDEGDPEPDDSGADDPDADASDPADEAAGELVIEDAQLRWGFNNESNNRAFAPGTFNFFSAGKIANPARGGAIMPESGWSASAGNVTIEKLVGNQYRTATWGGLKTDSTGTTIPSPSSGRFSNHQVVLSGGTGELDSAAGTATIRWDGDFTVLYYSGMSFFYVSDPVLEVEDGVGQLKATVGGYASSMEDLTKWEPLPDRVVTLADLPSVEIDEESKGFVVQPAFEGVRVADPGQVTSGPGWGSFPASFIGFQQVAGSAAYWFTSGGSADAFKRPLPVTVSFDTSDPIDPPPPPPTGPLPDQVSNAIISPPGVVAPPSVPLLSGPNAGFAAPAVLDPASSDTAVAAFSPASAATTTMAASGLPSDSPSFLLWWLGAAFLTLAGASVGSAFAYSAAVSRR